MTCQGNGQWNQWIGDDRKEWNAKGTGNQISEQATNECNEVKWNRAKNVEWKGMKCKGSGQ
eukprot:1124743-Pelagomonas_calceolata.AAC.7